VCVDYQFLNEITISILYLGLVTGLFSYEVLVCLRFTFVLTNIKGVLEAQTYSGLQLLQGLGYRSIKLCPLLD
jgi:hypothetical protein